jgi:G:T/U-mismatch repair DNA glycosylase
MSFAPVYDDRSRALILGTWPSPKSREMAFYYGHPQNRFWPLLAALTGEPGNLSTGILSPVRAAIMGQKRFCGWP